MEEIKESEESKIGNKQDISPEIIKCIWRDLQRIDENIERKNLKINASDY